MYRSHAWNDTKSSLFIASPPLIFVNMWGGWSDQPAPHTLCKDLAPSYAWHPAERVEPSQNHDRDIETGEQTLARLFCLKVIVIPTFVPGVVTLVYRYHFKPANFCVNGNGEKSKLSYDACLACGWKVYSHMLSLAKYEFIHVVFVSCFMQVKSITQPRNAVTGVDVNVGYIKTVAFITLNKG